MDRFKMLFFEGTFLDILNCPNMEFASKES